MSSNTPDFQKQVQEVDMWLRIAKSRGLRFSGDPNEWIRFSTDFKTLMHSLNPVSARIIQTVEKVIPEDIRNEHYAATDDQGNIRYDQRGDPFIPKEHKAYAHQVYLLLSTIVQSGPSRALVDQEAEVRDGFKAYSRLHHRFSKVTRGAKIQKLVEIIRPSAYNVVNLEDWIIQWENKIRNYETQYGTIVDDDTKSGVIMSEVKGNLRTQLSFVLRENTTYTEVKNHVLNYYRAVNQDAQDEPTSVPMQIDQVRKGQSKGFGKNKFFQMLKGKKGNCLLYTSPSPRD